MTSGCSVIMDISHSPFYGRLLGLLPQLEVFFIHLIRDPRAVAYSWSVPKPQPGPYPMRRIGAIKSTLLWNLWNIAAEQMQHRDPERFLRVRYEDFVLQPRAIMEDILQLLRERPSSLPFVSDRAVTLGPNHTLRGNPCRFQTGNVDLTEDLRWKTQMKRRDQWMTLLLAWPLALRYGYPIFPQPSSPEKMTNPNHP